MTEQLEDIIVIQSTFNKTPGMKYMIEPCPDKKGKWASCVRPVNSNGDMILSEDDVRKQSQGAVFIPQNQPITVWHGRTFNLNDEIDKAEWEAIKNSNMIAKDRYEKDSKGYSLIDGAPTIPDRYNNPHGTYGIAELYIVRPGVMSQTKNTNRRRINQAQNLILGDSLDHQLLICRLFDKDLSNAPSSDVEDFLMTKAEKDPDTVIKYYTTEESKVRLLLITAIDKRVIMRREDGMYYGDIKLGASQDYVTDLLKRDKELYESIKKETFPELVKSTKKESK